MAGVNPLTTDLEEVEAFTLEYDRKITTDLYRGGNYEEPGVKKLRRHGRDNPWDFTFDEHDVMVIETSSGEKKSWIFCVNPVHIFNSLSLDREKM